MPFLKDYPYLKLIQDIARQKKTAVYLVGGFLRDHLIGIAKMDFDFAVERDALKFAKVFATKIKGAYVLLDKERGCARVAKRQGGKIATFDFADFRAKTFLQDLAHRDFTINTLCVDMADVTPGSEIADVLKDHKKGLADLKAKRIKKISVKAFKDDPLRMMRAFSLSASLGFKIERGTLAQIRREKDLIRRVSYERVREELFKVLESPRAADIVKLMDATGLLAEVIPQLRVMFGCKQGTYHHLDVWPHSLETLAQAERILDEVGAEARMKAYLEERIAGEHSRRAVLKLACLLHDIGKPDTRKREEGRLTFHAHEHAGKNIATHVAKMLKLSTKERHMLEDMVLWHLRPGYLSNFKKPSEKSIYRYFRDTKDEAVSILLLSWADQRATRGPLTSAADQRHHEAICRDLVTRYFKMKDEKPFVRLIDGHDLIKALKLKPSPLFAEILSAVAEQQALGKVTTKKEALDLAREIAVKE